jgi:Ca2+-transporting ATPase
LIQLIHKSVPGRHRYKVKGLYRSEAMGEHLERSLVLDADIERASASMLTGNLLVLFVPTCNPRRIQTLVRDLVLEYFKRWGESAKEAAIRGGRDSEKVLIDLAKEREKRFRVATTVEDDPLQAGHSWHVKGVDELVAALKTSLEDGLSGSDAAVSLKAHGLNIIPEPASRSSLGLFVDQFNSLPVGLLSGAAVLSVFSGGVADAVAIMTVVAINAVIGFFTEDAAEKTIRSLKTFVQPTATIKREGEIREMPSEQVLVGDLLILRPGSYVAADARLVHAENLSADESLLTGESLPVLKNIETLGKRDIPVADRYNMVYGGTLITGGQGHAVVVATGRFSEIGKVQALVGEASPPKTPVEKQLTTMGNQLVFVSSAICGLVFLIGIFRGRGFLDVLKTSVSLAVAAVPEGLPAVATTTLALGIKNMRRRKVLFRSLDAVCTIGSVQTICLDKTGTLTWNRMSVVRVWCGTEPLKVSDGRFTAGTEDSNPYTNDRLLKIIHTCVLCNDSEVERNNGGYVVHGSPTENALVQMAISVGVDVQELRATYSRVETSYRAENKQFMTTSHTSPGGALLFALKGSPLEVLAKCRDQAKDGSAVPLTERDRELIEAENERMAGDGLRVLGVAYGNRLDGQSIDEACGLTFLGLVGMSDPVRNGVKESIQAFHRAGLETVMITGDQSSTAYAIGRELQLNNGNALKILDSMHLQDADPSVIKALSKDVNIFSRVSPAHKLQIVQALQSAGKIVAMTGDGINDGPALKAADVGIAMGHAGTDVAREVADVVLEEDDLETMIVALSHGRTIYNNIRKTLHYLLATNLSEILVMFIAGAAGIGYPLNAMQLLWINLVSDIFPGLALALEAPEPDVLDQPPRDPEEPIVKREDFKRISFEAATMSATALGAYGYGLAKYGQGPTAGTIAFHSLTTAQVLHALSCRSDQHTIFDKDGLPPNKYLNAATFTSLGVQVATQMIPAFRRLLGLTPIGALDALVIGGAALIPLLTSELTKKPGPGAS